MPLKGRYLPPPPQKKKKKKKEEEEEEAPNRRRVDESDSILSSRCAEPIAQKLDVVVEFIRGKLSVTNESG